MGEYTKSQSGGSNTKACGMLVSLLVPSLNQFYHSLHSSGAMFRIYNLHD
jgi:hypothetical protein